MNGNCETGLLCSLPLWTQLTETIQHLCCWRTKCLTKLFVRDFPYSDLNKKDYTLWLKVNKSLVGLNDLKELNVSSGFSACGFRHLWGTWPSDIIHFLTVCVGSVSVAYFRDSEWVKWCQRRCRAKWRCWACCTQLGCMFLPPLSARGLHVWVFNPGYRCDRCWLLHHLPCTDRVVFKHFL